MNALQAKSIPMTLFMERLGFRIVKASSDDHFYFSPLRDEKTPSFHVNTKLNSWYDFGIGKGGNTLDFTCAYLESVGDNHSVKDALKYLKEFFPILYKVVGSATEKFSETQYKLDLIDAKPLRHKLLVRYAEKRGIPESLAKKYLTEIRVHNHISKKNFFALGFANEENGFELRNNLFKGCLGTKAVSFVRGSDAIAKEVHIFEGFMDFLSALAKLEKEMFEGDALILNSLSMLPQGLAYINNHGYKNMFSWMDNDPAGQKVTSLLEDFSKQQIKLIHIPMNEKYSNYDDVNDWHVNKPPQLKLLPPATTENKGKTNDE